MILQRFMHHFYFGKMNLLRYVQDWLFILFTWVLIPLPGQDSIGVYALKDLEVKQKFYANGKIKREVFYYFGKKAAIRKWKYFDDTYEVIEYPEFKNLSHRIKRVYYFNNRLKSRATIRKGVIQGLYETWYITGVPNCKCYFKDGKQDSLQIIHHENGQVRNASIYKNGKIWSVISDYKFNGKKLDSGTLHEGTGYVNVYDRNGILIRVYYFQQGEFQRMENKLTGEIMEKTNKHKQNYVEDYLKI